LLCFFWTLGELGDLEGGEGLGEGETGSKRRREEGGREAERGHTEHDGDVD